MRKNRIKVYCSILAILLFFNTVSMAVGTAYARPENTVTSVVVMGASERGITSNCLSRAEEPARTVLLGESDMENPTETFFWIRSSGEDAKLPLNWYISDPEQEEYLDVAIMVMERTGIGLEHSVNILEPGAKFELQKDKPQEFILYLEPTETARMLVLEEDMVVNVCVTAGDTMKGIFQIVLPKEREATPEEPIAPEVPEIPETPVDPETPEDPETSVDSETPVDPETPEDPETSVDPETSEDPETPVEPETPENSEIPDDSEEPIEPEETPESVETPDSVFQMTLTELEKMMESQESTKTQEVMELQKLTELPETTESEEIESSETPEFEEETEPSETPEFEEETELPEMTESEDIEPSETPEFEEETEPSETPEFEEETELPETTESEETLEPQEPAEGETESKEPENGENESEPEKEVEEEQETEEKVEEEKQESTEEKVLYKLETLPVFDITQQLPVVMRFEKSVTSLRFGMQTVSEEDGSVSLSALPDYTMFSIDGGKTYSVVYGGYIPEFTLDELTLEDESSEDNISTPEDENIPEDTSVPEDEAATEDTSAPEDEAASEETSKSEDSSITLLLDFRYTELAQDEALTIAMEAYSEGELQTTCTADTTASVKSDWQVGPILTFGTTAEFTFPQEWKMADLTCVVEHLTITEEQMLQYVPVELSKDGLQAIYEKEEDNHRLILQLGEKFAQPGTYRLQISWSYEGLCYNHTKINFFVNCLGRVEPEVSGSEVSNDE